MSITNNLLEDGWREIPDHFKNYGRSFFKRFKDAPPGRLNSDKPGIQIQIVVSVWEGKENHEVFLTGELPDQTWFQIQQYSLGDNIKKTLTAIIPRMLKSWEDCVGYCDFESRKLVKLIKTTRATYACLKGRMTSREWMEECKKHDITERKFENHKRALREEGMVVFDENTGKYSNTNCDE